MGPPRRKRRRKIKPRKKIKISPDQAPEDEEMLERVTLYAFDKNRKENESEPSKFYLRFGFEFDGDHTRSMKLPLPFIKKVLENYHLNEERGQTYLMGIHDHQQQSPKNIACA